MIISIEGIDGAGKNTLVGAIRAELGAEVLAFPRYEQSVHARLAQRALHGEMGDLVDSVYGMATLFALDRRGAAAELRPYQSGGIVVLDRYVASNAAYSAARLAADPRRSEEVVKWVRELEFEQFGLPVPDLQVLLDTPPGEASARAQAREQRDTSRTRDRYERDGGLQERTYAAYRELARRQWAGPWLVASEPQEVVQAVRDLAEER
ncbi:MULTISPECIES: dTMP kinase [unclassified Corynebacterium]|uniref:dTMP kinase n=1 Tax=unclassified Corynebacterium TaxID=2624378 RepID=UPI0029C9D4C5|nr:MULTISPECIES: dTMP kinase [unclassified Corynebacterium]WPF66642.1 dTMP kinase [Corynebacterium sp. 22KM0430]WPF69130.1 dTMP kinase [Corynebacterium sp. 21KM1197]